MLTYEKVGWNCAGWWVKLEPVRFVLPNVFLLGGSDPSRYI